MNATPSVEERVRVQLQTRYDLGRPGIKVNLYTPAEVRALGAALKALSARHPGNVVESIMVGDSYFMTHGRRSSTQLAGQAERAWGLRTMVELVAAVHSENEKTFPPQQRPILVGDLPDGSLVSPEMVLRSAHQMIEAGADMIKVEVPSDEALGLIAVLWEAAIPVMAHIGYTPQTGRNRSYGEDLEEAVQLIGRARHAREAGALALVLERVSEPVNRLLSTPHPDAPQIYSIFSGRAPGGGQSLNIWDSVFVRPGPSRYFPPTAEFSVEQYPGIYTEDTIARKIRTLIELTMAGEFPKSPPFQLDELTLSQRVGGRFWASRKS